MQNMSYASNNLQLAAIGGLNQSLDWSDSSQLQTYVTHTTQSKQEEPTVAQITRRIVQVFIADPNDNVPLADSLLYKGDQKLTDATDQELFYEVPIIDILKTHNEKRIKMIDKEVSKKAGKDIFLEPAKIRDLKMIITNIAQF
jgi:hypothetical protein